MAAKKGSKYTGKVPVGQLVASARQLAVLVKAGIPLAQGVQVLRAQTEHPGLKQVYADVGADLQEGKSFSEALAKHPKVFSELFFNSVAAGEAGGVLDQVLPRLADMMERDHQVASEVKGALRYPLIVVVVISGAVIFLMTFVVPKFAATYSTMGLELPLPTKIMIALSNFLLKGWAIYVPVLIASAVAMKMYLRTPLGAAQADQVMLSVPVFGPLVRKMVMSRFCSMLSFLYSSGLPILKTLDVVSRAVDNAAIGKEIQILANSVREGKGLSGGLKKARYFPPLVVHMVSVGEVSGNLTMVLENVVSYYENDVHHAVKGLSALIEPLLTLLLGVVVLGLALAIFLPMWNMTELANRH